MVAYIVSLASVTYTQYRSSALQNSYTVASNIIVHHDLYFYSFGVSKKWGWWGLLNKKLNLISIGLVRKKFLGFCEAFMVLLFILEHRMG